MAFNYLHFQKWSQSDAVGANNFWQYTSILETIATITGAGYFDTLLTGNPSGMVLVGDVFWIVGSDGTQFGVVTDIDPSIVIDLFDPALGVGNVDTANLADLAVTTAKIDDNAVDTTKLALDTIQYAQVAMTAAEWNGMYAAPKQILAAPGAGLIYQVDNVWYDMAFVAAQYAAGGVANLQFDNTVNGAGVLVTQDTAAATINALAASSIVRPALGITAIAQLTTVNKGLFMSNKTGAFTTGDSTWKINVAYRIITA